MHHPVIAAAAVAALVFGAGSGIDRSGTFSASKAIPAYTGWYCFQPEDAKKSAGKDGPASNDELWSRVRLPLRDKDRCRYESRLVLDPTWADTFEVQGHSQRLYRLTLGTDPRGKPIYGYTTDIE